MRPIEATDVAATSYRSDLSGDLGRVEQVHPAPAARTGGAMGVGAVLSEGGHEAVFPRLDGQHGIALLGPDEIDSL